MKVLVVYYSRTGTTKKVAQAISDKLGGDIEEIIDKKDRKGLKGYLIAGKDAATKKLTEINKSEKDLSLYDIVAVGTPVWAFTMTPAIRTYLTQNKERLKNVAFFCTQGSLGSKRTFKDMEKIVGRKPQAVFEVTTKEVVKETYIPHIEKFFEKIVT